MLADTISSSRREVELVANRAGGGTIQPAADAAELGEECCDSVPSLDEFGQHPVSARASRQSQQSKAGGLGTRPIGAVGVGTVGLSRGQTADIECLQGSGRNRRRHGPRSKQRLGVATVVGIGCGHDCSPGHGPIIARKRQGSLFGPVHRGRPGLFAFFCRLLGAVEQGLIPVDPVQQVPFGPLPPGLMSTSSASQTVNRRWTVLRGWNPTGSNSQGIPATHP